MIKPSSISYQNRPKYSKSAEQLFEVHNNHAGLISENRNLRGKLRIVSGENENLRRVFVTAEYEFDKLRSRVEIVERELEFEKEKNTKLEKENKKLRALLDKAEGKVKKFVQMLFGTKSEKRNSSNSNIIPDDIIDVTCKELESNSREISAEETLDRGKKKRGACKGHSGSGRKALPDNLPNETTTVDINDNDKTCPYCGLPRIELKGMEKESLQLGIKIVFYIKKTLRKTYKTACSCKGVKKIITASLPPALIPKSKYNEEVWTDFLINKYQFHLPIERQLFKFIQADVDIKPGMVFNGLKKIYYDYLEVLHEVLIEEMRKADKLHADETRWNVFLEGHKNLWYMWGFRSTNIVLFVVDPTRAAEVPLQTLFNFTESEIEKLKSKENGKFLEIPREMIKKLNVDRYSAYKVLEKYGLVLLSFCWVHQRRDIIDVKKRYDKNLKLCLWADEWLAEIANLYYINNRRVEFEKETEEFKKLDTELRISINNMKLIIDSEKEYPHEIQNKIMKSMKTHWSGLTLFVDYPELPMDNNLMENSIRPGALGRKNYIGNHSLWGTKLAACMYSVIQTCLINNINPREYLNYYFQTMIKLKVPNKETDRNTVRKILPHNLKLKTNTYEKIKLKKY
jgi:transposase